MNPGTPTKMANQAMAEWDRLQMMEYGGVGNAAAYYTYATAGWLAEVTDHKYTSMLSSVFRKAQRSPEQIVNFPLRVVSTLKIILAGLWRNITLQPIGIIGPLLVGPNSGRAIANTMRVVTHRVIDRKSFRHLTNVILSCS